MKLLFQDRLPVIESAGVVLRDLRPVLNGAPLDVLPQTDVQSNQAQGTSNPIILEYRSPALQGGMFRLELEQSDPSTVILRCALENVPPDLTLDSFGVRWERIENLRALMRSGYYSWDGTEYIQVGERDRVTGYALTQLLAASAAPERDNTGQLASAARAPNLVLGFTRHDRFQHTFTFETAGDRTALRVETLWDRRARADAEPCQAEPLWLLEHQGVEDGLRAWAQRVAAYSPVPPRHSERITGWCSWYNLYAAITEENILEHLRGVVETARRHRLPLRVFQIDDGFTPEMGDWLEVKPQFPRGMKPLLDDIRAQGFIPGLWIAPLVVGNRSHLYQSHPDWVVRDRRTGGPLAQLRFYGEFRWHKRSEEYYILDTTHPDAFDYLRRVFRTWHADWGCDYFKTDFMYFGCEQGPDRAVWHTPGRTRIEIWRRVAEMIRAEIGGALWLGCGCPLWAPVGLVDGMRIGRDMGVAWRGEHAARSVVQDLATRNFANRILWQADPDCVLLRERFHELSENEIRALALAAGMVGGVLTTSDALDELSPERLRLWKFLLQPRAAECRLPLLGTTDPVLVQVRAGETVHAVFAFNLAETPVARRYALEALGLPSPLHVFDWTNSRAYPAPVNQIAFDLDSHAGALWLLSAAPLTAPPEFLPVAKT